ncbi:MAG: hypothetical protein DI548_07490, partial [Flavobacterium johnsoniae]
LIIKNFVLKYYKPLYIPPLYFFPDSQWMAYIMYGTAMLIFLFSIFKPCHAVFKGLAWFIHIMFYYRNLPTVYGGDLVLNAFFIFYVFSEAKSKQIQTYLLFAAKTQLAIIYFNSGVMKLQGQTWLSGTAISVITNNGYMGLFRIDLLKHMPIVSAIGSWAVVLFEIFSPFGFWVPQTRKAWFIFGILMHLGIAVYMGLWFFSLEMIAAYVFFLDYPALASSSPSEPMASTGQPSKAS